MKQKGGLAFFSSLLLLFGLVWLVFNYQFVIDKIVVSQFRPTPQMSEVINDIQLTEHGRFMTLAAQPVLSDRETFNKHCEKKAEQTVVLGCYIGPQRMYIYNVTDDRLSGIREVTTAHEMLHVAYDRLSYAEKKRVNQLVEEALPQVQKTEPDLADRLKIYEKTEPGERSNELHSILGTEAVTLPSQLEEYYSRYFTSRSSIVALAESYDKVFENIKQQQDSLLSSLNVLSKQIDTLTSEYESQVENLNQDVDEFNKRADQEGYFSSESEFYAARSELVSRRNTLEAKRKEINAKIDEYDKLRAQLDAINVQVKELNSKIDSSSVPSL